MKRLHLFEFEDLPWFPSLIREYMTDYLNFTASLSSKPFEGLAQKMVQVLSEGKVTQLVDLCSGGAGPLPQLIHLMQARHHYSVRAVLTDLYPNLPAFEKAKAAVPQIDYVREPVDATAVPSHLHGFRTLFNGFHHFPPELARKILADAVQSRQGIFVVELVGRSPVGFITVLFSLLMLPLFTPFIRPFRISRIIFTYIIPIVPLCTLWDGIVSCFRVYSPQELRELTESIPSSGYRWEAGTIPVQGAPGHMTVLIGRPE